MGNYGDRGFYCKYEAYMLQADKVLDENYQKFAYSKLKAFLWTTLDTIRIEL